MADPTNNSTLPAPVKKSERNIVVNRITIRSVDRSSKDVGVLRSSHKSAENPSYPNRTRLYDVYDDVMSFDGHLIGITGKREMAVLNKTLQFIGADGKKDENFDKLIVGKQFREVIKQIMLKKMWGLRGMEFVPGPELDVRIIPTKHIKPKWGIIAFEQSGTDGVPYAGVQNIWVLGGSSDFGLLLTCSFYSLLKRGVISDWAQYIEIFGQPLRVVKYDGYDTQTDTELDKALENAGASMYLKIPKEANLEVMDGKTSNGDGKLQDTYRQAMNEEMSVAVLTNTETTTSSKSSGHAQSQEHGRQQLEVTKCDLVDVAGELNSKQFLGILKSYGWATDGGHFEFAKEIEVTQVSTQMDVAGKAKDMGVPVSDEYIYSITGIPKPEDYDKLKEQMAERAADQVPPQPPKGKKKKGLVQADPDNLFPQIRLSRWERFIDFFAEAWS